MVTVLFLLSSFPSKLRQSYTLFHVASVLQWGQRTKNISNHAFLKFNLGQVGLFAHIQECITVIAMSYSISQN